jgi:hypothetical protein
MQKISYSLPALRELLATANRRYLELLSAIEDPRNGRNKLDKLSQPRQHEGRSYPIRFRQHRRALSEILNQGWMEDIP